MSSGFTGQSYFTNAFKRFISLTLAGLVISEKGPRKGAASVCRQTDKSASW